ncbi:MAG: glycosyltransferase family 2 protein, partial [Bacteroidetes bacterium]|nr:glycosyltransferase family 2 protein [Bacteroidota bacterium]
MNKVIIVMPAYKAEKTLEDTYKNLPQVYQEVIVCDDAGGDRTFDVSKSLKLTSLRHHKNQGYGGNQKTLYKLALEHGANIIIMVHPDNQYSTDCIPEMIKKINNGSHLVIGSRMKTALKNHMPFWKYVSNRFLTVIQNFVFKTNLSEFHSGLRAYNAHTLKTIPYQMFSNDFVFDSEMIACIQAYGYSITEVDTECFYNDTVSSINLRRSIRYGLETLKTLLKYMWGTYSPKRLINTGLFAENNV